MMSISTVFRKRVRVMPSAVSLAAVFFGGLVLSTNAQPIDWLGGDGNWGTGTNWSGDSVPVAGDTVQINETQPFPTLSSGDYTANNVYIIQDGLDGSMTMTGGSLGIENVFVVGRQASSAATETPTATFTMSDGRLGSSADNLKPAQIWVGYTTQSRPVNGVFDLTGGRVDVRWNLRIGMEDESATGQMNIHGGEVHLWQRLQLQTGSNLDLAGDGYLRIWNRWGTETLISELEAMIDDGRITGGGLLDNVSITTFDNGLDDGRDGFELRMIPEPSTVGLLLAAVALVLFRRRSIRS